MELRHQVRRILPVVMLVCSLAPAQAQTQFFQQGPKLVGTGAVGPDTPEQGVSVSLSGDGNTAIVGGIADNHGAGAAWVFTRSEGVWSQQAKLVGTGAVGTPEQGISVSLSGDGNTAIVGGFLDNNAVGAVWVFTRSGGVWSQQGPKLVGTGALGSNVQQGISVSLSGDGNTAIIGGPGDSNVVGAAWVFARSGRVWSQQGPKLVGTGAVGSFLQQGRSVSLSGDGDTAIIGGPNDNNDSGAAWVFTRSGGVWSQQGPKLVGTGAVGSIVGQGASVSLSGDGNTAIVGGPADNPPPGFTGIGIGAAWVFTRSEGVWNQQVKLVGTDAIGNASQGVSVSISGDGNTGIVGGYTDNNDAGAAWLFTRSGGVWSQQGPKLVGTGAVGSIAGQGTSVSLSGDGNTAIVGGPGDNKSAGAAWVFAPFAGTPGKANCYGKSVSALVRQYHGLNAAAAALGFSSVRALQNAILAFCEGCRPTSHGHDCD